MEQAAKPNRKAQAWIPFWLGLAALLIAAWSLLPDFSHGSARDPARANASHTAQKKVSTAARRSAIADLVSTHRLEHGVARAVGGRAFIIRREPERRPPGDAATFVRTLSPASVRGEADATYRIYLVMDECERAASPAAMVGYQKIMEWTPDYPRQLARTMEECQELLVHPSMPRRGQWLSLAAQQGSVEAAIVYAMDIEQVVGGPRVWADHPERVVQYKRRALGYLHQAADLGSVDALSALSEHYDVGFLTPSDLTAALAYRKAADRAHPTAGGHALAARLSARMTAAQIQQATQQASVIYQQCCTPR